MPKHSLSQNFLNNPAVAGDLVRAAAIKEDDVCVEIGPGKGMVTRALLKTGARIIAIEKDDNLAKNLREKFAAEIETSQLRVVNADILEFDPKTYTLKPKTYVLVGSIPYNITGRIFRHVLSQEVLPETIVFLVQKEVAERITTRPVKSRRGAASPQFHRAGNGKESILSLSVKAYGAPQYVKTVKARNFTPAPAIDSAILAVHGISRDFFKDIEQAAFFDLVRTGFASRRKTLANNIRSSDMYSDKNIPAALTRAGIEPSARAEDLTLEQWRRLYNVIFSHS